MTRLTKAGEMIKKVNISKLYLYCPFCESNETNVKIGLGAWVYDIECVDCGYKAKVRIDYD